MPSADPAGGVFFYQRAQYICHPLQKQHYIYVRGNVFNLAYNMGTNISVTVYFPLEICSTLWTDAVLRKLNKRKGPVKRVWWLKNPRRREYRFEIFRSRKWVFTMSAAVLSVCVCVCVCGYGCVSSFVVAQLGSQILSCKNWVNKSSSAP
jgi:hypothetical protein